MTYNVVVHTHTFDSKNCPKWFIKRSRNDLPFGCYPARFFGRLGSSKRLPKSLTSFSQIMLSNKIILKKLPRDLHDSSHSLPRASVRHPKGFKTASFQEAPQIHRCSKIAFKSAHLYSSRSHKPHFTVNIPLFTAHSKNT